MQNELAFSGRTLPVDFPKPYPFQVEMLDGLRKGWAAGFRKQLVVSPTGSGKTKCMSWQSKEFVEAGHKVLILVDQKELVTQTVRQLKDTAGLFAEIERAEFYASKHCNVVVATIQTMCGRKEQWPADHFGLVIADEGDKSISPQWLSTLRHFDTHAKVTAYTATPKRTDKRSLGEYYDNIAFEISLLDLVQQGYLSPICIQMAPLKIDLNTVSMSNGDFDVNDLDHAITPYLSSAVDAVKQFAPNRKTLVFLPLIKTSERFIELCRNAGLKAEHIDGSSEDRSEILERYKRNEFSILANSSLLLRGYDQPDINCVFILRPTKSSTLYRQCVGRGTRLAHDKDNLLLIDCLWQSGKHMTMRPASLIACSDEESKSITELSECKSEYGEQDLLELASEAASQREEALRKKLEELKNRKSKFISAEEFAISHHQLAIAEFEPTMRWHSDSVTPAQAKYIEQAGIDLSTVRGKGHASILLDTIFKESGSQPATNGQRWVMRQSGWLSRDGKRNASQATRADAREFFAARNKKKVESVQDEVPF